MKTQMEQLLDELRWMLVHSKSLDDRERSAVNRALGTLSTAEANVRTLERFRVDVEISKAAAKWVHASSLRSEKAAAARLVTMVLESERKYGKDEA